MNIAIIGTGYVGLVTGTCFAETGNHVVCVDIDEAKVAKMKSGVIPIFEPGLSVLFERNTNNGRLSFTTDLAAAVKGAEIVFLALPTPPGADGSADLSYVLGVAKELSTIITKYTVIVDKSTVPVGTAEKVAAILAEKLDKSLFDVVSNPEFLREGVAVDDFLKPDRVVIGTSSAAARQTMERLYLPFVRQGNPIFFMDERSAEVTKYAANSYLATRISFMNEIANLCELVGADVDNVRRGMGADGRIGKRFLFAGIGYGGSCFPKDVKALAKTADDYGYDFQILKSVMDVNKKQKLRLVEKMNEYYDGNLSGKVVAMWGLAFKPNTDDIREAPALEAIDQLLAAGATVQAFDPEAMENVKAIYGDKITFVNSKYDATKGADCLAIMTEWNEFRTPDFGELKQQLSDNIIFDGRNLYALDIAADSGLTYMSIGRSDVNVPVKQG
ncbi:MULTISPECIES: UDP-glucose/GDP-mannose dehydrogenase family protein [unclassified Aureispira]|uniref:UDP-glucose dehydrogenase family protein n=1 Tax=unclassified Aureispira TaxID=2649989 RepID=UPI000698E9EE|nr:MULTISPECIES: UDP-glucose/GDP-mannose dehydrogenase family protein [unclassified Aureispira]WMX17285.1 UDP-glucose/GDP-mannose dehydrogenase family protein [Aureispira sp. CCB-E]